MQINPLLQCSLLCVWFPNNSIWHLLDLPNRYGPFLGFGFDSQTRRNFLPGSCSLHLDSELIPHHTYGRYVNKDQIKLFLFNKISVFLPRSEMKAGFDLLSLQIHAFFSPFSNPTKFSWIVNYSNYFLELMNHFWTTQVIYFVELIFLGKKRYLKHRNTILTKTACVLVEKVKREEKVSSVSGQTEQTSFCSWVLRDDSFGFQMTGIDMIWGFSTICNNDLFPEPTNCQVITSLGWKRTIFWHR